MSRTLIIIKPDAVERRLIGEILARFESKGLRLVEGGLRTIPVPLTQEHYAEHAARPFFDELVAFITRSPAFVGVLEGPDETWKMVRVMMGPTDPSTAPPGTIRGDFGTLLAENLIHGSDSDGSALREIALFFPDQE